MNPNYRIIKVLITILLSSPLPGTSSKEVEVHPNSNIEVIDLSKNTIMEYPVVVTNYYTNDATGSTSRTGSGMSTDKFDINDMGWYTYDEHVVLATATYECLASTYIGCRDYNELPDGYIAFEYWDIVRFEVDGVYYDGVVLDSCGSCLRTNKGEDAQRIDIFIAGKEHAFGKLKGNLLLY